MGFLSSGSPIPCMSETGRAGFCKNETRLSPQGDDETPRVLALHVRVFKWSTCALAAAAASVVGAQLSRSLGDRFSRAYQAYFHSPVRRSSPSYASLSKIFRYLPDLL